MPKKKVLSPSKRERGLEDENSQNIAKLNKKWSMYARAYYLLAFLVPALFIVIILFFYSGFEYEKRNMWGLIFFVLFFYLSASFFIMASGKLYKRKYLTSITFWSLSYLMWVSAFVVMPIRYGIHVLPEIELPNLKGVILTLLFSSVGVYPLLLVDKAKRAFLERRSIMSIAIAIVHLSLVVIILPFSIKAGVLEFSDVPYAFLAVAIVYAVLLVTYVVLGIVFEPNDKKIYLYVNIAFIAVGAILLGVLGILGYTNGDYAELRLSYFGSLFAFAMSILSILSEIAFYTMMANNRATTGLIQDQGI